MEKTDQVTIEIDKGKRINRIRIRGDKDDVTKAFEKITNIFHEAGRLAQQEMEAKLIAKEVISNLNTQTFYVRTRLQHRRRSQQAEMLLDQSVM